MKKTAFFVLLMFLIGFATISCESKEAKLARAKELLNRQCSKCHFSEKIYKKKYTKEDWQATIDRMVVLSKETDKEDFAISHQDAYEILIFLQEDTGD
jgi:hypothetical protein